MINEDSIQLDTLLKKYYEHSIEKIVFADDNGKIIAMNDASLKIYYLKKIITVLWRMRFVTDVKGIQMPMMYNHVKTVS